MKLFILYLAIFSCTFATRNPRQPQHRQRQRQRQQQQRPVYEYDDYYYYQYEDEVAPTATGVGPAPASDSSSSDYDLSDLVKAWKEYIKDRSESEPRRKPVEEYECPPREEAYRTGDLVQCDKFTECNIKGEEKVLLCPDGLVFDIKSEHCDYPAKVNCSGRPDLQEPQPSENCPRANGFFAFPANESCQKFWDCREGKSYLQTCPQGVIFDPSVDACVTPDQSRRPECRAGKFLGFECPKYTEEEPLRFGNHDRLASPKNCQEFFSCSREGEPRLGNCPRNKVFNNATGACSDPAGVPGCENYWADKEVDYEYYT